MSDATPDGLDLRNILSRIDRNQAETRALLADAGTPRRDRLLAPAVALGAIAALASSVTRACG